MLKKIVFYCAPLFALLFLLTAIPPEASADEGNSCVACHSKPEIDNITGRNFQDWKGSIHDENGVLCESCHHGNPDSATKTEAHKGVFRPGDLRSTVYFKNVPATCGECHREEYNQFKKSLHYLRLETTEQGPSCVTCHGARASKVVTPPQMKSLCTICHNKRLGIKVEMPRLAHSTLLLMNQTTFLMGVMEDYLGKVEVDGETMGPVLQLLKQSRNSIKLAKIRWHTFDLDAVEKSITGAWDATEAAWSILNP